MVSHEKIRRARKKFVEKCIHKKNLISWGRCSYLYIWRLKNYLHFPWKTIWCFSSSVERFNSGKIFWKCENIEFCVYKIKVGDGNLEKSCLSQIFNQIYTLIIITATNSRELTIDLLHISVTSSLDLESFNQHICIVHESTLVCATKHLST